MTVNEKKKQTIQDANFPEVLLSEVKKLTG